MLLASRSFMPGVAWRAALCVAVACSPLPAAPPAAEPARAPGKAAAPAKQQTLAPPAAAAAAPAGTARAFVRLRTPLRRQPDSARQVVAADGKRKAANVLAWLERGEEVALAAEHGDFLAVRLSDGSEGFVAANSLRVGAELVPATHVVPLPRCSRPDVLTLQPGRNLPPGSIVLVLRDKESFAEVDAGPGPTSWVFADALLRAPAEVAAAKLFALATARAAAGDEAANDMWLLLARRYGATEVATRLAAAKLLELGAPGPAPAGHLAAEPAVAPALALPAADGAQGAEAGVPPPQTGVPAPADPAAVPAADAPPDWQALDDPLAPPP